MPRRPNSDRAVRSTARLNRDAILAAAIALADRDGLEGLSMRRLGEELGVNPMSVYHHVEDKDALLGGMVESVVAGIATAPVGDVPWTEELRALVLAARRTVLGHPWAVDVLRQQETPSPAVLRHIDRVLGALRRGGCSVRLAHHALHVLGSRVLGFSQDLFDDSPAVPGDPAALAARYAGWATAYPYVVELAAVVSHEGGLGGCDDDEEFGFALDLLLDGLERRRRAEDAAG
ncbi:TetR/AcrR family transcriptional regulator [Kineosporia sp. A_224]|uniref:TetR/AcrR family transcriptional regulator n=1 Tax=Kineosporia sp. A_224 TaxID=1962180 RepID=UPI0018E9FD35|nr:TetR/AcrR family transcriptional regulator C-terminal domain-containing protein [Kineosporia sp. A_224]